MDKKYYTARMLKKNSTIQEKRLWNLIKNRQFHNLRFKRQVPIGNYIVDFLCPERHIVIEIDGGYHLESEQAERDLARTDELNRMGYKVLRFTNEEVLGDIDRVLETIAEEIDKP